ncbi:hypothetical protein, partial [Pseudomonas aeruginosa]|uniref:hypothetical protein n=1 Tax=Pseudomonas aeruginosa TaxID=287 RepID=UPI0019D3E492
WVEVFPRFFRFSSSSFIVGPCDAAQKRDGAELPGTGPEPTGPARWSEMADASGLRPYDPA